MEVSSRTLIWGTIPVFTW